MDLLKEIFDSEVFPAMGCTEPISCAYTTAAAVEQLQAPLDYIELMVNPGTFKNGAAVTIPNSGGQKGNEIAAALGAIIGRSEIRFEILKRQPLRRAKRQKPSLTKALELYPASRMKRISMWKYRRDETSSMFTASYLKGIPISPAWRRTGGPSWPPILMRRAKLWGYREARLKMKLEDVLNQVVQLDDDVPAYIQRGIEMNLAIAEKGVDMKRNAYQIRQMMKQGSRRMTCSIG